MMKQRWVTHLLASIGLFAGCAMGCDSHKQPVQNAPINPKTGKEEYIDDPILQGKGSPIPAAPKMPASLKRKDQKK